ncbi:JmjC domain-containing protein 7 [Elysia marginata]|uniref:JmjC domain-containing protein 7 n=1 Tax=Elysia marginata TaxID=1093978 RepID=A0AAV4IE64_9GAST|nr:JmjC domain-containing protein 7 [Elysia marginata]
MAANESSSFSIYSRFSTWDEFFEAVKTYCDETYQPFVKRSSKKHGDTLVYQTFQCTHRGVFTPRGKGLRETKSSKEGCLAKIHAHLSKEDRSKIVVTILNDKHNHEIGPDLYNKYVKQRSFTKPERDILHNLINLNLPSQTIRQEMCRVTGKEVTMQDIHNVKRMLRKSGGFDLMPVPPQDSRLLAMEVAKMNNPGNYHSHVNYTRVDEALGALSEEMKELYPNAECQETAGAPDPLQFYRNFVSQNRPLLINDAFNHWPALEKWNENYLRNKLGDTPVTVSVTPNGYADAVYEGRFVMPEERTMPMSQFLDILFTPVQERKDYGVFYIQKQNSNLTDEFSALMEDVDSHIPWGSTAFGVKPEAVNFWMGDEKAITSRTYRSAVYKEVVDGDFTVIEDEESSERLDFIRIPLYFPFFSLNPEKQHEHTNLMEINKGTSEPLNGIPWKPPYFKSDNPNFSQFEVFYM